MFIGHNLQKWPIYFVFWPIPYVIQGGICLFWPINLSMIHKQLKERLWLQLQQNDGPVSLSALLEAVEADIPERTARRWLRQWVDEGVVERVGRNKGTSYCCLQRGAPKAFSFLDGLDEDLKDSVLKQLRDQWTHSSTAIEGNTLTLGDTHFLLEEGLTISGKPLKDHQEVLGHAQAIDLLYQMVAKPIRKDELFALHLAVQTSIVNDIYKPNGAWKLEPNGTYTVTEDGRRHFIEYALPKDVDALMGELFNYINRPEYEKLAISDAPAVYARLHMGLVHIHPFWDGNGRIARLLANIPLLRSGLPPLMISQQTRREYIHVLAEYQLALPQLSLDTGVWPEECRLSPFIDFCDSAYQQTLQIVEEAKALQQRRSSR